MNKRQDIQGLRGWAIGMVVLFHFFPDYFPNGYIGVDVFFVISGYLIAMMLQKYERLDVQAIFNFYYRRIRRILPLYYLAIVFIMVAILMYPHHVYEAVNSESSWRAIALISNFKIKNVDLEYEKVLQGAEDLFAHTWSLSVEMQFYLLVPIVFLVQQSVTLWRKTFFLVIASCSFAFYIYMDEMISFYWVFSRIWQFSLGIIGFLAQNEEKSEFMRLTEANDEVMLIVEEEEQMEEPKAVERKTDIHLVAISGVSFLLLAVPSLMWKPCSVHLLRTIVTLFSAPLIYIGHLYEPVLLSHYMMAYFGNISYALYLVHWPVYALFKNASCEPLIVLSMGIVVSVALAALSYHFYETHYLKWSRPVLICLIIILLCLSVMLCYQIHRNGDAIRLANSDIENVNPKDAAWNITLRFYLNKMESDPVKNMQLTFCTYSKRFLYEADPPYGFCSRENGTGRYDILVIGNSFACNQGELVFNAFKNYSRHFSVFCLTGECCEVMTISTDEYCQRRSFNYSVILEELKPDIIFVVSRVITAKQNLDTGRPIIEDKIYKNYMRRMSELEAVAKKVYLLQALPTCMKRCIKKTLKYTKANTNLTTMKEQFIDRDEYYARLRIAEVGRRCKKCEIIDYMPVLLDDHGRYRGFDVETNLVFIDGNNHFNRFGKERIQTVYDQLAQEFGNSEL